MNTPMRIPVSVPNSKSSTNSTTKVNARIPTSVKKQRELEKSKPTISKEQLTEEMKKIHDLLDNIENDWEERAKSMERLQSLALEVRDHKELHSIFIEKLNETRTGLSKQVRKIFVHFSQ